WGLTNHTRFAADRALVRDMHGAEVWLVVVKGTFKINPDGSTSLAEEQEDVCLAPKFFGEPGKSSLRYESDLVPAKSATDVLLHGHAYAPNGKPVPRVDVTLKVGALAKTLSVFGNRLWKRSVLGTTMTDPQPFQKIPLTYEHAFGGIDQKSTDPKKHGWEPRNPVGIGLAVEPQHLHDTPAPHVEDPKDLIRSWKQRPRPAGFGPIARHWSPRAELAGTHDTAWEEGRMPLLPVDFKEEFHQCAPEDQRVQPFLKGGEPVELCNLTPGGVMRFGLPQVTLGFETSIAGGLERHRPSLHTVILEPDEARVIMVWHTSLPCHHTLYSLISTSIIEKKRRPTL
ncbi:MAG TPA: DUF2169 domain-containing protein, partial [Gemmata sp.]|nr:DUF2169 domain-containing protein [Gemmata sp.]